jgi:hypothetical protein
VSSKDDLPGGLLYSWVMAPYALGLLRHLTTLGLGGVHGAGPELEGLDSTVNCGIAVEGKVRRRVVSPAEVVNQIYAQTGLVASVRIEPKKYSECRVYALNLSEAERKVIDMAGGIKLFGDVNYMLFDYTPNHEYSRFYVGGPAISGIGPTRRDVVPALAGFLRIPVTRLRVSMATNQTVSRVPPTTGSVSDSRRDAGVTVHACDEPFAPLGARAASSASGVSRAAAAGRSCDGADASTAATAMCAAPDSGGVGCSVAARSCSRAACATS